MKLNYLLSSIAKSFDPSAKICPSCRSAKSDVVDRKWLVTSLRRCQQCRLLFRTPTTSDVENKVLYQTAYTQGFTTDCPADNELARLLQCNFRDSPKDYSVYISLVNAIRQADELRLFDFGCSWGYGSYQLRKAGFQVDSFDISQPRARYAHEKLGVTLIDPASASPGSYDIFFSSHVIEHVPSVSAMIATGMTLLKPGGLFVAFTPNASQPRRENTPDEWHQMWGSVHPQVLDLEFLETLALTTPLLVASSPYDLQQISGWPQSEKKILDLSGSELFFAFRKLH